MKIETLIEGRQEFDGLTGGPVPLEVNQHLEVKRDTGPGSTGKYFIPLDDNGWYLRTDGEPGWGSLGNNKREASGYFDTLDQAHETLNAWQGRRTDPDYRVGGHKVTT